MTYSFDKRIIQDGLRTLHNQGIELTPQEFEAQLTTVYNFIRKSLEMCNIVVPKNNNWLHSLLSQINMVGLIEQKIEREKNNDEHNSDN